MTTHSLHNAIQSWLRSLPSHIGVRLDLLPAPPAMLDVRHLIDGAPADSSGLALDLSAGEHHLCAWLPVSGQAGSYYAFTEGDDEIGNFLLPAYADESSAIALLDARLREHLLAV